MCRARRLSFIIYGRDKNLRVTPVARAMREKGLVLDDRRDH